ncbi:hypothetical protein HMPREF0322_04507 [Desulfitobacterium hafniense DP7]|uniref:Uncharacterized protein n=1 Tax=Desulfitobacterium hafniense DP7 TaxID=537010 RepID=G9XU49_DESHA|nr:hypothetical protein HMPREF0322_04507 [Desulfitobacterium hafniense DP7]
MGLPDQADGRQATEVFFLLSLNECGFFYCFFQPTFILGEPV